MKILIRKIRRHVRAYGVRDTVKTGLRRLFIGNKNLPLPVSDRKVDILSYYNNILGHEHGTALADEFIDDMTMQWVIPDFGFGSGGHLNIFRFINNLADLGYKQRLVIVPPFKWKDSESAAEMIASWYAPLKADIELGIEGFRSSQFTFATGWQTAYWVKKHRGSVHKFYFIQDFEPFFYPVSSDYFLAEGTYRLGLKGITAGYWLKDYVERNYGMHAKAVSFGCDIEHYRPRPRRAQPHRNVLFYSRHVTPRRLFEIGLIALEKVCAKNQDVAVIFAGGDVSRFKIQFPHLNCGELSVAELPDLYSQCEVALVLSGTNLSLLPLEVSACGCPVVINDEPSTRWLLPENAAYYSPTDPDRIAEVIESALSDEAERTRRVENAMTYAQQMRWEDQARKLIGDVLEMSRT